MSHMSAGRCWCWYRICANLCPAHQRWQCHVCGCHGCCGRTPWQPWQSGGCTGQPGDVSVSRWANACGDVEMIPFSQWCICRGRYRREMAGAVWTCLNILEVVDSSRQGLQDLQGYISHWSTWSTFKMLQASNCASWPMATRQTRDDHKKFRTLFSSFHLRCIFRASIFPLAEILQRVKCFKVNIFGSVSFQKASTRQPFSSLDQFGLLCNGDEYPGSAVAALRAYCRLWTKI